MIRIFHRSLNMFSQSNISKIAKNNTCLTLDSEQKSATITLTNEKKRNPLSLQTITELQELLRNVQTSAKEGQTKILILNGEGTVFSAGHDLKELNSSKEPAKIFDECTKTLLLLKKLQIPTICAIDGLAAAAGFQLAMTCDMIFATQKSSFSTPGVKWGLFCSTPGVQLIRSISSQKKANEMLLFGQPISAAEAYNYGLLNRVLPDQASLKGEVDLFIKKAGKLSGEVIALGKKVLAEQKTLDLQKAYCVATVGMSENILQKSDCRAGLAAFAAKEQPKFKN